MARIDDYREAVRLGKAALKDGNGERIAERSGARFSARADGEAALVLPFLNREMTISWPALEFRMGGSGKEAPLQQQVLLLHYLRGAGGGRVTGEWIAYQEVPDGKFYLDAFHRRAKQPMVQAFGERPERLADLAARAYGAVPFGRGDVGVVVQALPLIPVALVLWRGDDEFPPDGNILFDRGVAGILSAEDIAWLAGMIIYPLTAMAAGK